MTESVLVPAFIRMFKLHLVRLIGFINFNYEDRLDIALLHVEKAISVFARVHVYIQQDKMKLFLEGGLNYSPSTSNISIVDSQLNFPISNIIAVLLMVDSIPNRDLNCIHPMQISIKSFTIHTRTFLRVRECIWGCLT